MKSSKNQIETKILKSSLGEIFFAEDFYAYGSAGNIRLTLFRLVNEGILERLAQGIYLKPKRDPLLGTLYPTTEEIAKQIAQRDKARIAPTGVFALHLLGLTTQVPLKAVYLTDGSAREVKIGKRSIKFKKTVPKSFVIKDDLLHLVVQAFREVGQKNISEAFLKQIKASVLKLDADSMAQQLKYAPVWIQKAIRSMFHH